MTNVEDNSPIKEIRYNNYNLINLYIEKILGEEEKVTWLYLIYL